jgi:dimethylaniline monooxygenase (N-oxide forming)
LVSVSKKSLDGDESSASQFSSGKERDEAQKKLGIKKYVFDYVMVATGHHWKPRLPDYPGVELYQGKMLHSHSYRMPYPFKDQRVLIVGVGNSGLDIASELASHAKQVYISSRSGAWILPKFSLFGLPTDHLTSRAISNLPRSVVNFALEAMSRVYSGNLEKFGLKPSHHLLEAHPTVNSEIFERIAAGKIIVKPNVSCFVDSDTVQFEDDTDEQIDVVVYCTGYSIENHFLESSHLLGQEQGSNKVRLYKHIFCPNYNNIAWIGLVQPIGSVLPVSEMQARWAARVFSGKSSLPDQRSMWDVIEQDWERHCSTFIPRDRHTIQVDYVPYMDMLAKEIGCLPDVMRLWMKDWILASQVTFGPAVPSQYRLSGPGSWEGASMAIAEACKGYDFRQIRPT